MHGARRIELTRPASLTKPVPETEVIWTHQCVPLHQPGARALSCFTPPLVLG